MRASTCILLLCVGGVLSQGPPGPQGKGPKGPPGPQSQQPYPPTGPSQGQTQGGPAQHHGAAGQPAGGPGQPAGGPSQPVGGPAKPGAGPGHPAGGPGHPHTAADQNNPWHELLHRMMDLMTAAASGGPLPGDQPVDGQAAPGQGQSMGQGPKMGQGMGQGPKMGQGMGQGPKMGPAMGQGPKMGPAMGQGPSMRQGPAQGPGPAQQGAAAGQQKPMQQPQPMPAQPKGGPHQAPRKPTEPVRQVVADCFWDGNFYRPGSDIVRGQHDRWCYVTYCNSNGKVQFWDDYNCPPNSMKPTSTHSSGSGRQASGAGAGAPAGAGPTTKKGCYHKNLFYEPGQEIDQHAVGERCYGTYCSFESQVVQWEDWCASGASTMAPTAGSAPAAGGGGGGGAARGGGGGAGRAGGKKKGKGRRKQGGGGGGGGANREIEAPQRGQGQGGRGQGKRQGGGGRGQGQGQRQGGGGGRRGGQQVQGCYHNGLYYQPNEDVIIGNIGDMCYGYYCEGNNVYVHWEDRCKTPPQAATAPAVPTTVSPMTGFFF